MIRAAALAGVCALACSSGPANPVDASAPTGDAADLPDAAAADAPDAPVIPVVVLASHPHDPTAFTEGLVYAGGFLYESTGLYGQSTLRQVDIASGSVLQRIDLDGRQFGEGLALVGQDLVQLTYREHVAMRYRLDSFSRGADSSYAGEGWGLCYDGEVLWMSNGSSTLVARDPASFAIVAHIDVQLDGHPVEELNELECVGDRLYANVWRTTRIVMIDKAGGVVRAVYEAAALLEAQGSHSDVLNGIAYVPESDSFLITGKDWPTLYEVDLPAAPP